MFLGFNDDELWDESSYVIPYGLENSIRVSLFYPLVQTAVIVSFLLRVNNIVSSGECSYHLWSCVGEILFNEYEAHSCVCLVEFYDLKYLRLFTLTNIWFEEFVTLVLDSVFLFFSEVCIDLLPLVSPFFKMDGRRDGLHLSGRKMTNLLGSGNTLRETGLVTLMIKVWFSLQS